MSIWLYDDFNWPSGDAAGKVSAIPDYRLKAIKTRGERMGEIVAHSNHNAHLFGEKHFPDLLSDEAVDYFISLTHEAYYQRFSEFFGDVIVGIFTDEASIAYCCRAVEHTSERPTTLFDTEEGLMPYYDTMKADYRARCGRDFDQDMQSAHEDFYSVSVSLFSDRFRHCYIEKLSRWCRAHRIIMTGHLWRDDTPFHSTKSNGDFLKNLSAFMMPGVDEYRTDLHSHRQLSLLAAAQYARGDMGAMIELFALGPCDMTYSKRLCAMFLAACFGIDHYFLAISPLDLRGNYLITDFFNCFTAAQPDFEGMRLFAEYANLAAEYADMDYVPDLYIRHPYPICAKHYAEDFGEDLAFTSLLNLLSRYQIQWKYATEDTDCGSIPVVSFRDRMEYCYDGRVTQDPEEVCRRYRKPLLVTDREGNAPEGLFVRRFENGEVVVLNLFGRADEYLIDGTAVFLPVHGVWLSKAPFDEKVERIPLQARFALRYRNDNLTRLMFLNDTPISELECGGEHALTLSVRTDTEAMLDGMPLALQDESSPLLHGMDAFYRSTPPLFLPRGVHTITSKREFKYLPSVFVRGNCSFELHPNGIYRVVTRERKNTYAIGETFSDYGCVEFSASVSIPANAEEIELNGTDLYTRLELDGQALGACIAAPYRYAIPMELRGRTVELKLLQYSSMGPIFGDTVHYDRASARMSWRDTPATGETRFGFSSIQYILKKGKDVCRQDHWNCEKC